MSATNVKTWDHDGTPRTVGVTVVNDHGSRRVAIGEHTYELDDILDVISNPSATEHSHVSLVGGFAMCGAVRHALRDLGVLSGGRR